jgi:hypothetical protein
LRLQEALNVFPPYIRIPLGPTTVDVGIKLKEEKSAPREQEDYVFEASYNNRKHTFHIFIPKLRKDGTYDLQGNLYVGVPMLEHPPVVVENRPRSRRVIFTAPASAPLTLTLFEKKVSVKRRRGFGSRIDRPYLLCHFISERDREVANHITGSTSADPYVTKEDLEAALVILKDHPDYVTDPRHLDNMRVVTLEEALVRLLVSLLQRALIPFARGKEINKQLVHDGIESYLKTSPQCQLYQGHNPMALLGLREKIKVPMERWAPVDVAKPHGTWEKAICVVDTPQSERAGEILALCHNAKIVNGKIVKGDSNLSGLLRRVTPFPHMIDPHRKVMMSAIAEQTCDLGDGNEPMKVTQASTEEIPQPFGLYAVMALMDYGETHEDGCVISSSLANRLVTTVEARDIHVIPRDTEDDTQVLVEPGERVVPGQRVMLDSDGENVNTRISTPGIVRLVERYEDVVGGATCKIVKITYDATFYCEVGSKVSGLHSNKATVSRILSRLCHAQDDGWQAG